MKGDVTCGFLGCVALTDGRQYCAVHSRKENRTDPPALLWPLLPIGAKPLEMGSEPKKDDAA